MNKNLQLQKYYLDFNSYYDFLAKPIKIDELETMIVKHVNSLEDH